ncbi:MAG: mucoidy inhibitor MuiA family protein [Paracoccaceae bacterium]
MRVLPLVLAFFPTLVLADEFTLQSRVSDVTLYGQGANIVRRVPFQIPAGSHELRLIDLPAGTPMETLRVKVEGAAMGSLKLRESFVPPVEDRESPELKAARAEVERLEEAVRAKADEASAIRAASEAADTRIAFLRQLGQGDALSGSSADQLREVARMVGEETQTARQAALEAEGQARAVDREVKDLTEALEKARAAERALVPEAEERNLVAVQVSSEAAADGVLEISYFDYRAEWMPVYDAYLDRKASQLVLKRGAYVRQETGENWEGVALTLSTNAPSGEVAPGELWPERRRIVDPPKPMAMRSMDGAMVGALAEPVMESPVVVEEAAMGVSMDGLSVSYSYPEALDLASGADAVRLALGELSFDAEIKALAVPKRNATAFLVAEFTNTSGELILPSALTQLFRDGAYVGQTDAGDPIPAGAEARLPFGPIEGLRLSRVVTRNEGDVGVLSRSNRIDEKVRIEIENLTGEAWPLRVEDQVPYSEQEDLAITWSAQPRPAEVDVDDRKGILAWESEIGAGATAKIELGYAMEWPDGKELR